MIFLKNAFCSDKHAIMSDCVSSPEINSISLGEGEYKNLYVSDIIETTLPEEWDEEHTKMWAKYENNTLAANNEIFNLASTDHLVIKRREKEGDPWTTVFVKETNTAEDFIFEFKDYYARSGVDYEYRLVSYSNGEPNMYMNITDEDGNNYRSEFKGYYIANKDNIYGTYYNVDGMNTTRNILNQPLQLLNNKYMNVVSNGLTNADTGTFTGAFIKFDDDGILVEEGRQFRQNVMNMITSKKPLILKLDDGRIWAIKVTSTPTDSSDSHPDVRTISFDWAEIGNPNDSESLYKLGLTNTDGRWW